MTDDGQDLAASAAVEPGMLSVWTLRSASNVSGSSLFAHAALSILIVVILTVAAVFGIQRIKIDRFVEPNCSARTRPEFKQFEQVSRQFPIE